MKNAYQAAPGVATVNGEAVPEDRVVQLTPAEAMYDLAHGNITPVSATDIVIADPVLPRPARGRTRK